MSATPAAPGTLRTAAPSSRSCDPGKSSQPASSEVPAQVHAGVETRDLITVTVERQRRRAVAEHVEALAGDAAFGLLAPARVVDGGIHVRVKTIFVRGEFVPRRLRLRLDEFDPDDRFGALEAVLPRHDQAQR